MTKHNLHLHEEILLLALKDEKGIPVSGTLYGMALGGAILAELLLEGRIEVETVKKKKYAKLIKDTLFADPVLDEALRKIVDAKRRVALQTWVSRFANLKKLRNRVAEQLVRKGILRADEDKVLLIFSRKIFPEVDPGPERRIIESLRTAIFTEGKDIDPRTVILLSLAQSTGLLKAVFDKKELKSRKGRIEKVINGDLTGQATREAIQAMQAAIMVAVIIPAVISTTAAGR